MRRPARRELGKAQTTKLGGRLPEQPTQLCDRDALTTMRVQVLVDPLAERQRRRTAALREVVAVPARV